MTAEIILGNGRGVALVDDEDFEWLSQWRWHCHSEDYAARTVHRKGMKRRSILMHREILHTPPGFVTDHINRNRLDNRRQNLRAVTHRVNMRNAGPLRNNTSGVRGVYWNKKERGWHAQSMHDGRMIYLGTYDDIGEAAAAYEAFNASVTPPLRSA